jgi:hypothetical protein
MQLDTTTATILSASVATAVSGLFTLLNLWLERRSSERRQARELAITAALEHWKIFTELAKSGGGVVEPLELYLIHMVYFVRSMDGKITPEKLRERIAESRTAIEAAQKELRAWSKVRENRTQHGGLEGL